MPDSAPKSSGEHVFPTTHWTVVDTLREAPPEERHKLLTDFLEQYVHAFRFHLRYGRRITHEQDLEDMVQGFVTDKFIAKSILDYVNRDVGRLRDYLRRSLDNYVASQRRSKSASAWNRREHLDDLDHYSKESGAAPCPFDVAWARSVMTEAVLRTKDQFFYGQRPHVWDIFDLYHVRPVFTGCKPTSYADLASKLGMQIKAVQNARVTALRTFDKRLREVISEYVGEDPDAIQEEMYALNKIMRSEGVLEQFDMDTSD